MHSKPLQVLTRVLQQAKARAGRFGWWFLHPMILSCGVLIGLTWFGAATKVNFEMTQSRQETLSELNNFALLFEQDVLRTTTELDRILKFLRRSYERTGAEIDWQQLIAEEFTVNNHTAQIAVIDRSGIMITSTAALRPQKPIDLSDREHFKVHVGRTADILYISKPVLGRASGKWSVQFTRAFKRHDGTFGGVIVISLDPTSLVSTYKRLQSQTGWAFALLGDDDIIRAGAGHYAEQLGRGYQEGGLIESVSNGSTPTQIKRHYIGRTARLVDNRRIEGFPLSVITSIEDRGLSTVGSIGVHIDYLIAFAFSCVVGLGTLTALGRDRRYIRNIKDLAHLDAVTGLNNRLSFRTFLDDAYAEPAESRSFAILLIDLDRFKVVNDTYGHPMGDRLLISVAARLKGNVRHADRVFRLGGDEFALIQDRCTTYEQAEIVAARLCVALAEPFEIDGNKLQIGSSIGIALSQDQPSDQSELFQAADMALYLAKIEGRGTFRSFGAELHASHLRRRQTEMDLAMAVERSELVLYYQPKYCVLEAPFVCGYEALVRWQHPTRGMVPPQEFIGIAEETGAIVSIGAWVLNQACHDLAPRPSHLTVAVNCSPLQLSRGNLVATVQAALAESGLAPHRLEIEITETTLMRDEQSVREQLVALRSLGVRVSLDDFGTGYSSLSYLHTYPLDCIKIDRSFVRTIGERQSAGPIIGAIVKLADQLGMTTVAEGVETADHLAAVVEYGCTFVQGYYFSPPRPAADILPPLIRSEKSVVAA